LSAPVLSRLLIAAGAEREGEDQKSREAPLAAYPAPRPLHRLKRERATQNPRLAARHQTAPFGPRESLVGAATGGASTEHRGLPNPGERRPGSPAL